MNIDNILKDFAKISLGIKQTEEKLKEENFVARLVICYEESDKQNANYEELKAYSTELDKLTFDYKIKANKYVYILHKKEFSNIEEFNKIQAMFKTSKNKILTINLKNFVVCKDFLNLALNILKENRQQTNK